MSTMINFIFADHLAAPMSTLSHFLGHTFSHPMLATLLLFLKTPASPGVPNFEKHPMGLEPGELRFWIPHLNAQSRPPLIFMTLTYTRSHYF